jgi:hypothetical protein
MKLFVQTATERRDEFTAEDPRRISATVPENTSPTRTPTPRSKLNSINPQFSVMRNMTVRLRLWESKFE